jgi:hypothetical protein
MLSWDPLPPLGPLRGRLSALVGPEQLCLYSEEDDADIFVNIPSLPSSVTKLSFGSCMCLEAIGTGTVNRRHGRCRGGQSAIGPSIGDRSL